MAAVAEDQVTKTKLILYQSIADVVQLTLTIFPLFIHQPGVLVFGENHTIQTHNTASTILQSWP